MMKNEKKLIKAIQKGDVSKVEMLAKDIPKGELATFINQEKHYPLWTSVKSVDMYKLLLSWEPQPKVFTLISDQYGLCMKKPLFSIQIKLQLVQHLDSYLNNLKVYDTLIYNMITSNQSDHQKPEFVTLFKLILERKKDLLKRTFQNIEEKNGTYLRHATLLQLAYFYDCEPAVEALLQHLSFKEMTEQLEAQVYTLIPLSMTKNPYLYYGLSPQKNDTCTDSQKNKWHIRAYIDGKTAAEKIAYFEGDQQKGPLIVPSTKLYYYDSAYYNGYSLNQRSPIANQRILNTEIIKHFREKGISDELEQVLQPSRLLAFPSKASACITTYRTEKMHSLKEEIASVLEKQPLTSEELGQINQLLSSIPAYPYCNNDLEPILLVLDEALKDFSDNMKESDIDKGETFYLELCALIRHLNKIISEKSSKDMTITEKDIFLKLHILQFYSLTQKLDNIPAKTEEENGDSKTREKTISSHAEALSVLKTINILCAEVAELKEAAQLKELAEKREKAPEEAPKEVVEEVVEEKEKPVDSHPAAEYTPMLNEGKNRILESYQNIDLFDDTLESIIKNMSSLWPVGNAHNNENSEQIQKKYKSSIRFKMLLSNYAQVNAYNKEEREFILLEAEKLLRLNFKNEYCNEIIKKYNLPFLIACAMTDNLCSSINGLTQKCHNTIERMLTQNCFVDTLKNKLDILYNIIARANAPIQEMKNEANKIMMALSKKTAPLDLDSDERLRCHKILTTHLYHQKLELLKNIQSFLKTVLLSKDFSALLKPLFKEDQEDLKEILEQIKFSLDSLIINLCKSDYTLALRGEEKDEELRMNIIYVRKENDQTLSYTYKIDKNLVKTGSVHFETEGELTAETLTTSQKELIEDITDTGSNLKQTKQLDKENKEILAILDLKPLPAQSTRRLPAPIDVRPIPSGGFFNRVRTGATLFARAMTQKSSDVQNNVATAKDESINPLSPNNSGL